MHGLGRSVLVPLPGFLGIDLSITNEVVLLWLAAAATFAVITLSCRRRGLVARGYFQNAFEAMVHFVDREVVCEGIGTEGRAWAPLLFALFFFVLFANLLGMVPVPSHFKAATSNLTVTTALASIVFSVTVYVNLRRHGVGGFARKFIPTGVPRLVWVLVVPIEIISWLAKPVSLAVRLFANMMAGHALILIFIMLAAQAAWFLSVLPLAGAVAMSGFELFVCFVQAFIFTMLAAFYIREALDPAH